MTAKISAHTRSRLQYFARHNGLQPEAADRLMAMVTDHVEALNGHRRAVVTRWADQTRTDAKIGRNALAAALHTARQAVDRFGGDRLRKALDETGLGSHPEIIRAFVKIGKATADLPKPGQKRPPAHEETMRAMYPSMYGNRI